MSIQITKPILYEVLDNSESIDLETGQRPKHPLAGIRVRGSLRYACKIISSPYKVLIEEYNKEWEFIDVYDVTNKRR